MHLPDTTQPAYPSMPAARFASTIKLAGRDDPRSCRVGLIGIPDDTGVALNSGRVGAAQGPSAFRAALAKLGVHDPMPPARPFPNVYDFGDVLPAPDLGTTHARVTSCVEQIIDLGLFPIAIGGGHDLTFPFVRASCNKLDVTRGVYFDAHLDVRAEQGSGMPFRALIEHCSVTSLACVGAVPLVNTRQHHEWFTKHGGVAYPYPSPPTPEQLIASHLSGPAHAFVSLDMDVMHMHQAPGVSAMNAAGLPADLIGRYILACGASASVRCFDIMELSPPHDESGRTARLAAQMFLMFLQGLARRG